MKYHWTPFNLYVYLEQLVKGFIDENQGDEDGEDLLGKTRDEADEETSLCRDDNQHNDDQPHSNPYTTHNVLVALRLTELTDKQTNRTAFYEPTSSRLGITSNLLYVTFFLLMCYHSGTCIHSHIVMIVQVCICQQVVEGILHNNYAWL